MFMIPLLVVLVVVAFAAVWAVRRPSDGYAAAVLARRFARGEIDAEEYERRRASLHS